VLLLVGQLPLPSALLPLPPVQQLLHQLATLLLLVERQ
jgi:hypothetical protein